MLAANGISAGIIQSGVQTGITQSHASGSGAMQCQAPSHLPTEPALVALVCRAYGHRHSERLLWREVEGRHTLCHIRATVDVIDAVTEVVAAGQDRGTRRRANGAAGVKVLREHSTMFREDENTQSVRLEPRKVLDHTCMTTVPSLSVHCFTCGVCAVPLL